MLDNHLHAAGGVVRRERLHLWVLGEKSAALRQRHGMRIHLLDLPQNSAAAGDQHQADAQIEFCLDAEAMLEQKIVIFVH